MANICDAWEDIQFYYGFEGLVVFCEGTKNVYADVASRVASLEVESELRKELETNDIGVTAICRVEVVWRQGDVTCEEQRLFPPLSSLTLPYLSHLIYPPTPL